MKLEMYDDQFIILYWVEGEEFFDSGYRTLEEATKRFEYLKNNWEVVFPEGLAAIELTDQYFDEIDRFKPNS